VPKTFAADQDDADDLLDLLHEQPGLRHLRVRRRGAVLTIESGARTDPAAHARLRRVSAQLWVLEIATHMEEWRPTGHRAVMADLAQILLKQFPWVLAAVG
jgi:hypothetical protein